MRRSLRYIALVLSVLLLTLVIGLGWLFGTNSGARWLLHAISRSTSVNIAAQSLEGALITGVRIENLQVSWPEGAAHLDAFKIRWHPEGLLLGRVTVNELSASNVRVQDKRPEVKQPGTPGLSWPRMTGFLPHLSLGIQDLRVEGFFYRRLDMPPVAINRLAANLRLSHGTLAIRKILFAMPQLAVQGEMTAGFSRPLFRADLSLAPAVPVSGLDRFDLSTSVVPDGFQEAEGRLAITGISGGVKRLVFESNLDVTGKSILARNIRMFSPGRRGNLTGEVQAILTAESPTIGAQLALNDLDLSKEFAFLNSVSGNIEVEGTMQRYRGKLSMANRGTGWRSGTLEARFRGTPDSIVLTSVRGGLLQGSIGGSARASWRKTIAAEVSLKVRGVNTAAIAPDWTGTVNMDVSSAVRLRKKKPIDAALSLQVLRSRVRGKAVTGQVKARLKGENIRLDRLIFRGKGFDISAAGDLEERINIAVRLSDLSLFKSTAQGRAAFDGWIRRRSRIFSGFLAAHATGLVLDGAKASSIELRGRLEDRKGRPFSLRVSLRDAVYNIFHAGSATLRASGTMNRHTIRAGLTSAGYAMAAKLTGAYAEGAWQAKIVTLSGNEPAGNWQLQSPASLEVSAQGFSLSPLVIQGRGKERLDLAGTIVKTPLSGSVSAEWRQIDISRANAWLTGVSASGFTSGRITGKVLPDERLDATAVISLSKGSFQRRIQAAELKAEVRKAEASFVWQGETLEGNLSVVLARYGHIDARLTAPLPAKLPVSLNRDAPLHASIKGQIRETGTLSFLFPGLIQESRGQIDVDISASGTMNKPEIKGALLLDKAAGYFPAAGIHITDIHAEAILEQNRLRIDSLKARSGKGTLEGKAVVALEGTNIAGYEGSLQGEKFQALFLPQMRMTLSPKIEFKGTREKLTARGEVRVPELLIYGPPKEAPVKPSEDVVIVGRREEAAAEAGLSMDIQIKIILGDRVIVKAQGADAQLGGEVLLTIRSAKQVTGKGEIKVTKGKYSAYGVSLDITRGRIFFPGGALENPTLDILALKTINDVKAGVVVTGTLNKPVVKLYSEPAMPDADILAYIVLGHPLGQDKQQGTYLMDAAGALLSAGQSVALQDQVKQRLGLDTIDIQSGGGNVSRSLVTIGKYLSSKLYVSYGRALFTGENLFRLRYKLGKRWELESQSGQTSGVDIFYMIQFD